jgi:WD40 repeat protein
LSGSHDGSIKLWDIKMPNSLETIKKEESVRDVKYSPYNNHQFAAAFESGIVEIFDLRMIGNNTYSCFMVGI